MIRKLLRRIRVWLLIRRAKKILMTPEMIEAQRRSFVYGNVKLSNLNVTVDDVCRRER